MIYIFKLPFLKNNNKKKKLLLTWKKKIILFQISIVVTQFFWKKISKHVFCQYKLTVYHVKTKVCSKRMKRATDNNKK